MSSDKPIIVENNSDFNPNVWKGLGTELDPYTISGLDLSEPCLASAIWIQDTDKYFEIKNCLLGGTWSAINLINVSNGLIANNLLSSNNSIGMAIYDSSAIKISNNNICSNNRGISIDDSSNIIIQNNSFSLNLYGIRIFATTNVSIRNNNFIRNCMGIFTLYSSNCSIVENIIRENNINPNTNSDNFQLYSNPFNFNNSGIVIKESNNLTVSNNDILENQYGIFSFGSNYNSIYRNNISNNLFIGINLRSSRNNTIKTNSVQYNSILGISLIENTLYNSIHNNILETNEKNYSIYIDTSSRYNVIMWNDFIFHGVKNEQQAYDNGTGTNISHNYWNDWLNSGYPDPYPIDGDIKNQDAFPQDELINYDIINPLSENDTGIVEIDDNKHSSEKDHENKKIETTNLLNIITITTVMMVLLGLFFLIIPDKFDFEDKSNYIRNEVTYTSQMTSKSSSKDLVKTKLYPKAPISQAKYKESISKPKNHTKKLTNIILTIITLFPFRLLFSKLIYIIFFHNTPKQVILDNTIRKKIILILKENEIEHYNSLRQILNCGSSVLAWHLQTLEYFNIIKSKTVGKYKVIYLKNSSIDETKIYLYLNIHTEQSINFIEKLLSSNSDYWTMKKITAITELPRSTTLFYCRKLLSVGIFSYSRKLRYYYLEKSRRHYLFWLIKKFHS